MAIHAHSTTAPIVQPRLLRGGGTVPCRVLTTDELLDEIRSSHIGDVRKLDILDVETDIGSADRCSSAAAQIWTASSALPGSGDLKSATVADMADGQNQTRFGFDLANSGDTNQARALHFRRELHQALDLGFALLDALGLPPLALDVIDDAIATLDALDAPDEDREDGGDAEPALGWSEMLFTQSRLGDPSDDLELTALERNGHGFIRTGADDAEQDDPPEDDDGAGDEDSGIGDPDGMAEQLAGWFRCPALAFSNGGYVG